MCLNNEALVIHVATADTIPESDKDKIIPKTGPPL